MTVDPIVLEVVRNGLAAVAEEMNATLIRTAYSPNIKERRDCSCALFDAEARMIAQAENIPVHLGAMPFSVAEALEAFPKEDLEPGDGILVNDPFRGGAHLPDLTLITPLFVEDQLFGFAANRAHHADIGGSHAGSVAATTDIYQEGLRIPPVRLFDSGDPVDDVMAIILSNTRAPEERRGDLRAQHAANRTGHRRSAALVDRHGMETVEETIDAILAYSERRMRAEIDSLPDGTYQFSDVLEDDGQGTTDIRLQVTVEITGEDLHVDFSGSASQTAGGINAVYAVTASATYYAIRCVTDPNIPPNAGCYRPISISAPEESIVHAEPPAAVVGGNLETSQRIVDVIFGAFAERMPERAIAASQGTMNNLTIGGVDPQTGREYAFYETIAGGLGARATADGIDGIQVHMTNTMNTPIEVLETAYPLRVRRYCLREDTGGAGTFRGGLGVRRDIEIRAHAATVSVLGERRRTAPFGIADGKAGATGGDATVVDWETRDIPAKSTHHLQDGDRISVRSPGGGGYGPPTDRDPDAIEADVKAGKISREHAERVYGWTGDGQE